MRIKREIGVFTLLNKPDTAPATVNESKSLHMPPVKWEGAMTGAIHS